MNHWIRRALAVAATVALTGCLWTPGKFVSQLALRKDGTFVLDYKGEILLQLPDANDVPSGPWKASFARCYADGRTETVTGRDAVPDGDKSRPCTAAEIARLKSQYEKQSAETAASKRKDNEQMAKLFGLRGADDAANRAFAAKLMKYPGWRQVSYRGQGLFDVDYRFEGRASQDFVFPMMPESDLMIPFIALRPRADGAVLVTAPALTGGSGPFGVRAKALNIPDKSDGPQSRAEGIFTIVTDGEILTNNSEDGASLAPAGRQLRWEVTPVSAKVPETLIRLR